MNPRDSRGWLALVSLLNVLFYFKVHLLPHRRGTTTDAHIIPQDWLTMGKQCPRDGPSTACILRWHQPLHLPDHQPTAGLLWRHSGGATCPCFPQLVARPSCVPADHAPDLRPARASGCSTACCSRSCPAVAVLQRPRLCYLEPTAGFRLMALQAGSHRLRWMRHAIGVAPLMGYQLPQGSAPKRTPRQLLAAWP